MSAPVLQTQGLRMAFGGLKIFDHLDFSLMKGERHAVIGPNGAGKSTFVNLVTGVLKPTFGKLILDGVDVTNYTPQERVRLGLLRTFQINTLFPGLSPLESVVLALCQRDGLSNPSFRSVGKRTLQIEEAAELLDWFELSDVAKTPTQTLPYGKQRILEVALAFSMKPKVLLLDEPAAGLSTAQGVVLFDQLEKLSKEISVLFIEHDMDLVFKYADRVSVFSGGQVISQGTPAEVRADPIVRKAYLGN